jgi:hypothetical protein
MLDCPKHGSLVQLIERVGCLNEKKSQLFLHLMLLLELIDGVDSAFDAGFKPSTKLVDAAKLLGIAAQNLESGLGCQMTPSFTNAYWANAWALIQCY